MLSYILGLDNLIADNIIHSQLCISCNIRHNVNSDCCPAVKYCIYVIVMPVHVHRQIFSPFLPFYVALTCSAAPHTCIMRLTIDADRSTELTIKQRPRLLPSVYTGQKGKQSSAKNKLPLTWTFRAFIVRNNGNGEEWTFHQIQQKSGGGGVGCCCCCWGSPCHETAMFGVSSS